MTTLQKERKIQPKLEFKDGILVEVIIENGPFEMHFTQKGGGRRTSLAWFKRFDGSTDEPGYIPRHYFYPAINQARAIFADYRRRDKSRALSSQARMI